MVGAPPGSVRFLEGLSSARRSGRDVCADVYGIRSDLPPTGVPCVLRVSVWLACRSRRHASASEHLRHNPTVAGLSITRGRGDNRSRRAVLGSRGRNWLFFSHTKYSVADVARPSVVRAGTGRCVYRRAVASTARRSGQRLPDVYGIRSDLERASPASRGCPSGLLVGAGVMRPHPSTCATMAGVVDLRCVLTYPQLLAGTVADRVGRGGFETCPCRDPVSSLPQTGVSLFGCRYPS